MIPYFMGRHREALECIKECYTLWVMNHMRNPGSMKAALSLIQSCLHNKLYEDAENYARHAYFMIAEMTDNFIPSNQYPQFLADASHWLAVAVHQMAFLRQKRRRQERRRLRSHVRHWRSTLSCMGPRVSMLLVLRAYFPVY